MSSTSPVVTGEVDVDDDTTLPEGLNAANATFDLFNDAQLTFLGDDALYATTIAGTGLARLDGRNVFADFALSGAVTAVNHGPATQGGDLTLGAGDDVTTLRNNDDGVWTIADDGGIGGSADSRFVNVGAFVKSGSDGVTDVTVNFISPGAVYVETGALNFSGPRTLLEDGVQGSGVIEFSGRAELGVVSFPGTYDYAASVDIKAGATVIVQGGSQTNTVYEFDAVHTFEGDDFVLESGATLVLGRTVTQFAGSADAVLKGGAAENNRIDGVMRDAVGAGNEGSFGTSGTLHFGAGARVLVPLGAKSATVDGRVVVNGARIDDIVVDGGSLVCEGGVQTTQITGDGRVVNTSDLAGNFTLGGGLTLINSGRLYGAIENNGDGGSPIVRNLAGAAWRLGDDSVDQALGGVVDNSGTITSDTSNSEETNTGVEAVFASLVHNNGVIQVQFGAITLDGAVDGAGQDLVANGYLTMNAAVGGSGQTVVFDGDLGTLTLGDLSEFSAHISQFDANGSSNTIAIANGAGRGGWSFEGFTEDASGASGVLTFDRGGGIHGEGESASLTLLGDYQASGFSANVVDDKLQITYSSS